VASTTPPQFSSQKPPWPSAQRETPNRDKCAEFYERLPEGVIDE
jgi:hypothetical protein